MTSTARPPLSAILIELWTLCPRAAAWSTSPTRTQAALWSGSQVAPSAMAGSGAAVAESAVWARPRINARHRGRDARSRARRRVEGSASYPESSTTQASGVQRGRMQRLCLVEPFRTRAGRQDHPQPARADGTSEIPDTIGFAGTGAAAAVACSIASHVQASAIRHRLDPQRTTELRRMLRDFSRGTPPDQPHWIGFFADAEKMIATLARSYPAVDGVRSSESPPAAQAPLTPQRSPR